MVSPFGELVYDQITQYISGLPVVSYNGNVYVIDYSFL